METAQFGGHSLSFSDVNFDRSSGFLGMCVHSRLWLIRSIFVTESWEMCCGCQHAVLQLTGIGTDVTCCTWT